MAYAETDEGLRRQIDTLIDAFQQPLSRPAVRTALNRVRRERLSGRALIEALSQLYHVHGLDARPPRRGGDDADTPPVVVCSEGFVV